MKLLVFSLLLLPFAAVVETGTVRGERQNVLSFLQEALSTTTEKSKPAEISGHKNSSSKPINVQDSKDLSVSKSTESLEDDKYPDPVASDQSGEESKELSTADLDSNEVLVPKAEEAKDQVPSRRRTSRGGQNIQIQDELRASGDQTDHNSTDGAMLVSDRTNRSTENQSRAGRANRMSVVYRSREIPDWDSLEDRQDRSPAGDESKLTDYDESRENTSSETYPLKPSSLSAPGRNRAA